jgi:uncharacterized membrane protein
MKYILNEILKGGDCQIYNKINDISNNNTFVVIICLILAAYSARVSQGYILPSKLYYLFNNIFVKILILFVVILVIHFNKPIGIMLILSYTLLMIAYYKQNEIENFVENFKNNGDVSPDDDDDDDNVCRD